MAIFFDELEDVARVAVSDYLGRRAAADAWDEACLRQSGKPIETFVTDWIGDQECLVGFFSNPDGRLDLVIGPRTLIRGVAGLPTGLCDALTFWAQYSPRDAARFVRGEEVSADG